MESLSCQLAYMNTKFSREPPYCRQGVKHTNRMNIADTDAGCNNNNTDMCNRSIPAPRGVTIRNKPKPIVRFYFVFFLSRGKITCMHASSVWAHRNNNKNNHPAAETNGKNNRNFLQIIIIIIIANNLAENPSHSAKSRRREEDEKRRERRKKCALLQKVTKLKEWILIKINTNHINRVRPSWAFPRSLATRGSTLAVQCVCVCVRAGPYNHTAVVCDDDCY